MKTKQKIVAVLFILCLVAPNILYFFVKPYVDTTNYENRELTEKPAFTLDSWADYPEDFENYLNDHAAFKNQFVKTNKMIDLQMFKTVESDSTLLGKDNWLFYKSTSDGNSIADYRGTNLYAQDQLDQIRENVLAVRDYYERQGIEFVLFIAPNKEQIYSEYMPDDVNVVSRTRRADQVVQYLKDTTDVKVVYPKDELLETKQQHDTYYKYDTHWNYIGGFIGVQQLMEQINGERLCLDDVRVGIQNVSAPKGLSDMINLGSILMEETTPVVSGYHDEVEILSFEHDEKDFDRRTVSTAPDSRSIFVVRDSFTEAMYDFIPKEFQKTTLIHRNIFNPDMVREVQPDIVVFEIVERYMDVLIDFLPVLAQ